MPISPPAAALVVTIRCKLVGLCSPFTNLSCDFDTLSRYLEGQDSPSSLGQGATHAFARAFLYKEDGAPTASGSAYLGGATTVAF